MGKTITEKILARAAGKPKVSPGEVIWVKPRTLVLFDHVSLVEWLVTNDLTVWDKDRVVIVFDHCFEHMERQHAPLRDFANKQGIRLFDLGEHGISHQVPAEHGYVLPGTVYINADTMAPTAGAFGCVALPSMGDTHVVAALGETWLQVPEAVKVVLTGALPRGISGKDVFMRVVQIAGRANLVGKMVEFVGSGLESLHIDERMALCNGTGAIGALSAIINPDAITLDYITPRARETFEVMTSDVDAQYVATYAVHLDDIEPMVAVPSHPGNVKPLGEIAGTRIDQAVITSCASARIADLAVAAEVVRGRRVAPGVRFIVTPASSNVAAEAARQGVLADLIAAGAAVTIPGCGSCWSGNHTPAILNGAEVCISSGVENSPGRLGSGEATIFLANAAAVAASALEGKVADPRDYLKGK